MRNSKIMPNASLNKCPRCGAMKVKTWNELTEDEKRLIKALPAAGEYPLSKRKKHRFCTRCLFEDADREERA